MKYIIGLIMTIRRGINRFISYKKGEPFEIDHNIPLGYIFSFLLRRMIAYLSAILKLHHFKLAFFHPSSIIRCPSLFHYGRNLNVERGCFIDALSKNGIKCGDNVSFGKYTHMQVSGSFKYIGKGIIIGNNVGLGTHGHYGGAGGLYIGNDTIIGNYVSFHPENHNYDNLNIPIRLQGVSHKGIKIGDNCWIGAKATILDGTVLGNGCIVAAGAVVIGTFPDNSIIGGVPAKFIKKRAI